MLAAAVERFFLVRERGTTLQTEILGGVTTFATMAYIIVVNHPRTVLRIEQ